MSPKSENLLKEALELPPPDRAELIEKLFRSFDSPHGSEMDPLLAKEAEDRIDPYEAGKIETIPAAEVFERADRRRHS